MKQGGQGAQEKGTRHSPGDFPLADGKKEEGW